ncbi:MAG TPA: Shedu anti-phage system protein SduA domain-containing protein [Micromonosporaceae bacterium]|nr:Shedu anti-phage system protein SduA domain-containing protein [Micromonosporaceae bacterium]
MSDHGDTVRYSSRSRHPAGRYRKLQEVVLKSGPRRHTTAAVFVIGSHHGTAARRSLVVRSCRRHPDGAGWDCERPVTRWSCDRAEIRALQTLLNDQFPPDARFLAAPTEVVLEQIESGQVGSDVVRRIMAAPARSPEVARALAGMDEAAAIAGLVQQSRQRAGLSRLQAVVEDPASTERHIQKVLEKEVWLFGGKYVRALARRQLVTIDQLDIPLVRGDGSLHVVELKQATIPRLVVPYRSHYIVGDEIHEAVCQVINYLRSLDEQRDWIRSNLAIDVRRASASVVIGHPMFQPAIPEAVICETIRTYNSHLSRVEVITFKELLDGGERSLTHTQLDDLHVDGAAAQDARLPERA